jgi:hypothetical protein
VSSISTTEPAAESAALYSWALAAPGLLLILATAAMLLALPTGVDPLWAVEPVTLSEAAAASDNGEVLRMIARGSDPNAASVVRDGLVTNKDMMLTPLEAAIGARRADMVELLLDNGAVIDAAVWARLRCFTNIVEADDVGTLLEARRPEGAPPLSCDLVETPWP